MLESLQYRDFRWMVAGSFVSFIAMNMQMITRGWLVLRLTEDSPLALAWVMASFAMPMTFVSLIGGALADRMPRRRLVILSQAGNVAMTFVMGTLDMTGVVQFWHVILIGVVNGSFMAFNMPSRQAMLSEIVPEKGLMNAISLNNSGMNLTRIIGPGIAGLLIAGVHFAWLPMDVPAIGTHGVFYIVSATYVFGIATTLMVNAGKSPAARSRKSVAGDMWEGLKYAASDSGRFGLVAVVLISTLFGFSYYALMPAWAREALDVGADGLGALMTIMGLGALAGTLGLAARARDMSRRGLILIVMTILWGICLAAFSQVTSYALSIPFLLAIGAISAVSMSMSMTMMQTLAAPEMRGRMMSIGMMTFGAMPLSSIPFGWLAQGIGTPNSLMISGALLAVVTLIFAIAAPGFRRLK